MEVMKEYVTEESWEYARAQFGLWYDPISKVYTVASMVNYATYIVPFYLVPMDTLLESLNTVQDERIWWVENEIRYRLENGT